MPMSVHFQLASLKICSCLLAQQIGAGFGPVWQILSWVCSSYFHFVESKSSLQRKPLWSKPISIPSCLPTCAESCDHHEACIYQLAGAKLSQIQLASGANLWLPQTQPSKWGASCTSMKYARCTCLLYAIGKTCVGTWWKLVLSQGSSKGTGLIRKWKGHGYKFRTSDNIMFVLLV